VLKTAKTAKTAITGLIMCTYIYNDYGIPTERKALSGLGGTFQKFYYNFDAVKGNLSTRNDLR
jgi:hypothetical protein